MLISVKNSTANAILLSSSVSTLKLDFNSVRLDRSLVVMFPNQHLDSFDKLWIEDSPPVGFLLAEDFFLDAAFLVWPFSKVVFFCMLDSAGCSGKSDHSILWI